MSLEERCAHQGIDSGLHVLFKEKWERCKNCAYDPENNKRCPDYSKSDYYVSDKKDEIIPEQKEKVPEIILVDSLKLDFSALPILQN